MAYFRRLEVWHRAGGLTETVYRLARELPADERFGLSAQLRRAATSIGANIAEGSGRSKPADFARCLDIAVGSVSELESHLVTCVRSGLLNGLDSEAAIDECGQIRAMLRALRRRVLNG